MRLSQGNPSNVGCAPNKGPNPGDKKDPGKGNMALGTDKLKASNFPASLLRIGRWEVLMIIIIIIIIILVLVSQMCGSY